MNSSKPKDELSAVLSSLGEEGSPEIDAHAIPIVLERIQEWAGEQPELTKALYDYAVQYASQINAGDAEAIVDLIVHKEIIENWQSSLAAPHLNKIKAALLDYSRRDSLLISYIQILQRGKVPSNNSPEQAALLRSGLAKMSRGKLKVANDLYAKVFNLSWVEQQQPGITKPVVIISTAANRQLFSFSGLYPKIAIAACALVMLGVAISAYRRESVGQAIAIPNAMLSSGASLAGSESESGAGLNAARSKSGTNAAESSVVALDRALFDSGTEHAQNSRWVPMMREFCDLSPESLYFAPAEKRLEQWAGLYKEDIQMARDIVVNEEGRSCNIAQTALGEAVN